MSYNFDPLVRPTDMPTVVPITPGVDLTALDEAYTFAAPDGPTPWPASRAALTSWRTAEPFLLELSLAPTASTGLQWVLDLEE
ncbi:hypothetical protein MF406_00530 [Georgenia sp. TF02-10]|uniref:hypothetical protein n=1 Tax=Georgenia sp. TF02-10 TaxID=2917725 RepID=UPI001FA796EB|nr:hypothetical protein [Georgenia sp. TF02-10]UNX54826.1 hypothetical protein MF406_00530 [Georgenia sp. TF02-10]